MTTHAYQRCAYCNTPYSYQTSGYGCQQQENSDRWCRNCAAIAHKALEDAFKNVPRKFKRVMVEITDGSVTVEELEQHRAFLRAKAKEEGRLPVERVAMSLYSTKDPDNHNITFWVHYNHTNYYVSYWTKEPHREKIEAEMELNVETGELRPWQDVPQHPLAQLFGG
jgi:hypothetical protein